jgi:hypothetical protein
MNTVRILLFLVLLLSLAAGRADPKFGRFFTTPAEREYLDQLRNSEEQQQPEIVIPQEELVQERKPVERAVPVNRIVLKGLVYRKGDKSTAWVNDGNSYEGDMGSQYTNVDTISPDQVTIDVTGSGSEVRLRVGQSYLPATHAIRDVISDQNDD